MPPAQSPAQREENTARHHGHPDTVVTEAETPLSTSPIDHSAPENQSSNKTAPVAGLGVDIQAQNSNDTNGLSHHKHSLFPSSKGASESSPSLGKFSMTAPNSRPPHGATQAQPFLASSEKEGGFRCPEAEILITSGRGYSWQIPEINFRKASSQFAALLDCGTVEPIRLKKNIEGGKYIKWKIEMVPNEHVPSDLRLRTFRLVDTARKDDGGHALSDTEILEADAKILWNESYDAFFRIICDKTESMNGGALGTLESNASRDKRFIAATTSILAVAEEHGATAAVRDFIEQNLLRMTPRLWFYIKAQPHIWLVIAGRIKSGNMFREAMCHVVGKIDAKMFVDRAYFEGKSKLHDCILKIMTEKVENLLALKKEIEFRITGFYPLRMYHPADNNTVPDRGVYTSDIYLYQTRALVMQYIAGAYAKGYHHQHSDGGIRFYRTLRAGGDAYLCKNGLANFHDRFAMSTRALDPFFGALNIVKDELKGELDLLFKDETQTGKNIDAALGYLTCTTVADEELPWNVTVETEADEEDVH